MRRDMKFSAAPESIMTLVRLRFTVAHTLNLGIGALSAPTPRMSAMGVPYFGTFKTFAVCCCTSAAASIVSKIQIVHADVAQDKQRI